MSNVIRTQNQRPNAAKPGINIEDARLIFKNFSGAPTRFDAVGGKRNFCIELDDETAETLASQGWNIKATKPKDDSYDPVPYLQVKVGFKVKPPKIRVMQGNKSSYLTEETIGMLDWAEIESADVVVTSSTYDFAGRKGISAYLQALYVTLKEDAFSAKYEKWEMDDVEE